MLSQTYDKIAISALVATFRMLFALRPTIKIIVAGAVRNAETFETFRHACRKYTRRASPHTRLLTFIRCSTQQFWHRRDPPRSEADTGAGIPLLRHRSAVEDTMHYCAEQLVRSYTGSGFTMTLSANFVNSTHDIHAGHVKLTNISSASKTVWNFRRNSEPSTMNGGVLSGSREYAVAKMLQIPGAVKGTCGSARK